MARTLLDVRTVRTSICFAILLLSACAVSEDDVRSHEEALWPGPPAPLSLWRMCTIANGTGIQGSDLHGAYGPCVATMCNTGYRPAKGGCVAGTLCPTGQTWLYGRCEGYAPREQRILVVPVYFDMTLLHRVELPEPPITPEQIATDTAVAVDRFRAMSYGRFSMTPVVTEPVTLHFTEEQLFGPEPNGQYTCSEFPVASAAVAEVQTRMDVSGFDGFAFVMPVLYSPDGNDPCRGAPMNVDGGALGPDFNVPELFPVPGTLLYMSTRPGDIDTHIFMHESMHNLGLLHAHGLDCGEATIASDISTCSHIEYGGSDDLMGFGIQATQTNVRHKEYLGWMNVSELRANGVYRLPPVESTPLALKIRRDPFGLEYLYLEYRTLVTPAGTCGLTVNDYLHDSSSKWPRGPYLLDFTPENSVYEGYTLTPGKSFVDPRNGLRIQVTDCDARSLGLSISGL